MTDPQLEQLLDNALASYGGEPAPGLEQRVLRRLHKHPRWPWAALAAAALLLLIASRPQPAIQPHTPPPTIAKLAAPPAALPLARAPQAKIVQRTKVPAGIPLSPQERRLVDFVRNYPELARQSLSQSAELSQPLVLQPLFTEPLEIKPLPPLTMGGE